MSSIKTRKHYVIFDMAFSGLWALFYFVAFCYMANAWRQSDEMFNFAKSNVIGAIVFAFLSVLTWVSRMPYVCHERKFSSGIAFSYPLTQTLHVHTSNFLLNIMWNFKSRHQLVTPCFSKQIFFSFWLVYYWSWPFGHSISSPDPV